MGLLFDGPPADLTAVLTNLEVRLGDIAESLSEIAAGIHMMGANQARAMTQEPPAFTAEDFGFDLLVSNPDQALFNQAIALDKAEANHISNEEEASC